MLRFVDEPIELARGAVSKSRKPALKSLSKHDNQDIHVEMARREKVRLIC